MNPRTANNRLGWDQVVAAVATALITLMMLIVLSFVSGHNMWVMAITAPFIWVACHSVGLHVITTRRNRSPEATLCKCACHRTVTNGATIEYGPSA